MSFSVLTDMAKTPADKAEDMTAAIEPNPYGYNLCLSLTRHDLDKLDLDDDCDVGDMVMLRALAKVTSVSKSEDNCRIELQITHMGLDEEHDGGDDDESY